jgi:hypothetical protein
MFVRFTNILTGRRVLISLNQIAKISEPSEDRSKDDGVRINLADKSYVDVTEPFDEVCAAIFDAWDAEDSEELPIYDEDDDDDDDEDDDDA